MGERLRPLNENDYHNGSRFQLRAPKRRFPHLGVQGHANPLRRPRRCPAPGSSAAGERVLVLDSGEIVMRPGDVVVQLGNWHGWTNPRIGSLMAFVMMGGKFEDAP